jgi:hypothetical protein
LDFSPIEGGITVSQALQQAPIVLQRLQKGLLRQLGRPRRKKAFTALEEAFCRRKLLTDRFESFSRIVGFSTGGQLFQLRPGLAQAALPVTGQCFNQLRATVLLFQVDEQSCSRRFPA